MGRLFKSIDGDKSIPVIEPYPCIPIYVSGMAFARVEHGLIHAAFYIEQPSAEGRAERVLNLRMVWPIEARQQAAAMAEAEIAAAFGRTKLDG